VIVRDASDQTDRSAIRTAPKSSALAELISAPVACGVAPLVITMRCSAGMKRIDCEHEIEHG
jgi:hypothetical protein